MTTKMTERGIYTGVVTDIQNAYKMKGGKNLHLITFQMEDGSRYVAEEAENDAKSRFVPNVKNTFEVTNPGKPGSLDWIRFISAEGGQVGGGLKSTLLDRENLAIAQTAMKCATRIGLKNDWTVDQIVNSAYMLAGNIRLVARALGEEML